jgi:hypothetical protein
MEEGDKKTSDDISVLEEVEGDQRVGSVSFFVYGETNHEASAKD